MIVIDEMRQRTLRTREGQAFLDRHDIVSPTVHHYRRTARDLGRWRQTRQIECGCHQEEPRSLQRPRCRGREKSAETGTGQHRMRGQVTTAGQ